MTKHSGTQLGAFSAILFLSLMSACHAEPPKSPEVGLTKPVDPPVPPDMGHGPLRVETKGYYNVGLGSRLREVCKGPAPFFDFDSAAVTGADQPTMRTLYACMIDGPLKGRSIRLIGHTDPRGTAEHNDKLGLERAERVKQYLVERGVDPSRIQVTSAGEDDARSAPADWPQDRRVQIELAR